MRYYVHIQLTGGFEIDAETDEEAEEKIKNYSMMNLVELTDRPVYSVKIGRLWSDPIR